MSSDRVAQGWKKPGFRAEKSRIWSIELTLGPRGNPLGHWKHQLALPMMCFGMCVRISALVLREAVKADISV